MRNNFREKQPACPGLPGDDPPSTLDAGGLGNYILGWRSYDRTRTVEMHIALTQPRGFASQPRDFHWLEKNIPCQAACPAHTDIPGYLAAISRGEYDLAYQINLRDNVFPAVLGRVCARPCEPPCRHGWEGLGDSVAICFSKRSGADFQRNRSPVVLPKWFPPSGRKVAVVGAGVAGLTAARELALWGHDVTVFEMHKRPGGMLNQGIPVFRLPREIIEREIHQIELLGVRIVCNTKIGRDIPLEKLTDEHDAVVMAAGTFRPNLLDIPGQDLGGIEHGLPFLLQTNEFDRRTIGKNTIVIGGGFTAMDCARTSFRLGARTTRVSYRRSVNEMLITPGELEELEHEGIPMEFMVGPKAYVAAEGNGHVARMRFVRNALGEPDASGRRRPVEVKGSEFEVEADGILLATGQFPDTAWIDKVYYETLVDKDEWLKSGKNHTTAIEKIFVAGDFATGARELIGAIGHAKITARKVDAFLMGGERIVEAAFIEDERDTPRARDMDYIDLQRMPTIPVAERTFDAEVETGYDEAAAVTEAQRCYLCHYKYEIDMDRCVYCNQCIEVKPRPNCIVRVQGLKLDDQGRIQGWEPPRETRFDYSADFYINQEDCIRCNACLEVCPTQCISVQKVSRVTVRKQDLAGGEAAPAEAAQFAVP
jgi:NADPH-dependent glutamate synthase beta subunit-like oxidoreductase/NAD-dependent dihydropyrimidine dehydrogenase PreA subunit